jgi:hypothetical protein
VAFTPWTTVDGYIALLERLQELDLIESVPPIQLAIRLLVPAGSCLLDLPGFREQLNGFDPKMLGYPWNHADTRVDALQKDIQSLVARAEQEKISRHATFAAIRDLAYAAAGRTAPELPPAVHGVPVPHMSEPWYCCAEPTEQQLQGF